MTEGIETTNIIELVVEVVASYISNNEIAITEIPELIQQVHRSLCNLRTGRSYLLHERSEPAVLIEDSIHPDYIVCLEDGRRLKMLKRHLRTAYNMTTVAVTLPKILGLVHGVKKNAILQLKKDVEESTDVDLCQRRCFFYVRR